MPFSSWRVSPIRTSRFVILRHAMPVGSPRPPHWDLLIEEAEGSQFTTWWIEPWPEPGGCGTAHRLPPHRSAYWELEGILTRDRGEVLRHDRGPCEIHAEDSTHWRVRLQGEQWRGIIELHPTEGDAAPWKLLWQPD